MDEAMVAAKNDFRRNLEAELQDRPETMLTTHSD